MADYWEEICGSQPKNSRPSRCAQVDTADEEDGYEGDLRVLRSVLDGCEASFTSADAARGKASTQFFDDTALMALLGHHDCVLWIANMRSAGKKQHYALAILETLFQHLPKTFTVGALYDIGCQLHRSCTSEIFSIVTLIISSLQYQFSMHLDIGGHANLFTILASVKALDYWMAKGVNISGIQSAS